MLSSNLREVKIYVDGVYVDVTLTGPGGMVILAERYFAYGGQVTLCELSSLIESEMRSSGEAYADFTLRAYTDTPANNADSHTFHILYCDRLTVCTDIPQFLKENFLTTLQFRRVPEKSTTSLFLFADKGEVLEYSVSYNARVIESGANVRNTFYIDGGTATTNGIRQIDISAGMIIADASAKMGKRLSEMEVVSFTINCGQRSATFFVDRSIPEYANSFAFRNCFNLWEVASLPLLTTAKMEVDRSTATVNGTSLFYDQSVNKTYEVTAGPITSDEADWIEQLLTSRDLRRFEPNDCDDTEPYILQPILITDMTCDISDSDEKPNIVKFTWRYTDNRAIVRFSASRGIFSSPFDTRYS